MALGQRSWLPSSKHLTPPPPQQSIWLPSTEGLVPLIGGLAPIARGSGFPLNRTAGCPSPEHLALPCQSICPPLVRVYSSPSPEQHMAPCERSSWLSLYLYLSFNRAFDSLSPEHVAPLLSSSHQCIRPLTLQKSSSLAPSHKCLTGAFGSSSAEQLACASQNIGFPSKKGVGALTRRIFGSPHQTIQLPCPEHLVGCPHPQT